MAVKQRKIFCEALSKELELPKNCNRIVSLSPAITEALFRGGVGDSVIGVSGYCVHPEEARSLPKLGSYNKIKLEKLRELSPDIVFMTTGYQRETALKLSEEFSVYAIPLPPTLSAALAANVEALLAAGYPSRASKLQSDLWDALSRSLNNPPPTPLKLYYEIDLGGPVTFGAYSYITDLFRALNCPTPYEEYPSEWVLPEMDLVLKFDPEIIIYEPKMFGNKLRNKSEVLEYFKARGLSQTKAIREEKVFITPGKYDFFAHYGPSLFFKAIPWLNEVLKRVRDDIP